MFQISIIFIVEGINLRKLSTISKNNSDNSCTKKPQSATRSVQNPEGHISVSMLRILEYFREHRVSARTTLAV